MVSAEQAATICHCSLEAVRDWRKRVLPRPSGSRRDPEMFDVSEVVAMAAGQTIKSWRTGAKSNVDQFVARLALRSGDDRDWVAVYESRHGIRIEAAPFVLELHGTKKGAIFDPGPSYAAFDQAVARRTSPS